MVESKHTAELGFSPRTSQLELVVPYGTKFADLGKIFHQLDASALARLPRGCNACISGHPFNIRERFEEIISVELPQLGQQAGKVGS
jgi:hypothetical protein